MKAILITVIIVCISDYVYSNDNHTSSGIPNDVVECIFTIRDNASITINKKRNDCKLNIFSKQYLQNIGYACVMVKGSFDVLPVELCHSGKFYSPVTVYKKPAISRAIVYASECIESEDYYGGYDVNKDLRKTFNLGVKFISREHLNIDTLRSHFWPNDKPNVWQQIYDKINHLLDHGDRERISKIIDVTEGIKEQLFALKSNTTKIYNEHRIIAVIMYNSMIETSDFKYHVGKELSNLYIIPFYSNYVTLAMYYFQICDEQSLGDRSHKLFMKNLIIRSSDYINNVETILFENLYETIYAGGLYNVIMNAHSYYAVHFLEMYSVWKKIYGTRISTFYDCRNVYPLSYSNLYGKATANLLEQAIHIDQSPLVGKDKNGKVAELNNIYFYIIKTRKQLKTVYGLKLEFSSNLFKTMGTTKIGRNIQEMTLDLKNRVILELRVYKTNYIRCLQFILSKGEDVTIGNNCNENSTTSTFNFEGHYIHSLYLANDYRETKKYFDNVAVSYLPLNG